MNNPGDFNPDSYPQRDEYDGPPRILLYGAIGLLILVIVGGIAGIFIFRNVLRPGQQERVVNMLPFMSAFQYHEPTPVGGVLPTPVLSGGPTADPMALLNIQVGTSPTPLSESTEETFPEATPTNAASAPSATPTPTQTLAPTFTPTSIPTALPTENTSSTSSGSHVILNNLSTPSSARMFGFIWQQQTWNNCGPANVTIALSYFGWGEEVSVAENYLKPNREDKNVSPHEIANFINDRTAVRALTRIGGDVNMLRQLIANEFPVIIETSAMFEAYDWIGHYRTPVAYDDVLGVFYIYDSFLGIGNGEGVTETYKTFDEHWQSFNRVFIVIYKPEDEARLAQILGDRFDEHKAAEIAFNTAQEEARSQPQSPFPWFNMGTALNALGRYQEATAAFDKARQSNLPWRMLWYQFGPFEAYYEVGRYDDILSLAQSNLNNAEELEESYYWRGKAYEAQGKIAEAAEAYRLALRHNSQFSAARDALDKLNS